MSTNIGILYLQKILTICFGQETVSGHFMQKIFMIFNYSYIHSAKYKRWLSMYVCTTILYYVFSSLKSG